ncbi:MAG: hypothetical protein ABL907_11745 [Hyphomicrobium sp.]
MKVAGILLAAGLVTTGLAYTFGSGARAQASSCTDHMPASWCNAHKGDSAVLQNLDLKESEAWGAMKALECQEIAKKKGKGVPAATIKKCTDALAQECSSIKEVLAKGGKLLQKELWHCTAVCKVPANTPAKCAAAGITASR